MSLKTAFVVSKFPCYDEAFILREMKALSAEMDILIFSLRSSQEPVVHDEARALLSKVVCVPYFWSRRVLFAQFEMFFKHPAAFLAAFWELVLGNIKSPEFLIKNIIFFPKSVYLAKWLTDHHVTHLHAYWATYPASSALVASRITGIPFSFTGHAHDIYLNTTDLGRKIHKAKFVSTCTNQNRDYLAKLAPASEAGKFLVNYHGLSLEEFSVNGKTRNKQFQILSVGTLKSHKGFSYLLQALTFLKEKRLDFHCTIIGGGPLEPELHNQIQELGLGQQVTMTGPLRQREVISYYKQSDLLVLMAQPEWHWGIPNVLIEALAAKTPVITTRFGSVEELVRDGDTGLLVPSKDPRVLAETVERLYRDEALRLRLRENGHQFVIQNFDLKKNTDCFRERFRREANASFVA